MAIGSKMEDERDNLAVLAEGPRVDVLLKAYEQCAPVGDGRVGGGDRLRQNERVRFCIWEGQSDDGKKWDANMPEDRKAFPWNGASDARTFLVDGIIEKLKALKTESFWRAMAKVQGVQTSDFERASRASKVLQWVKETKLQRELIEEVELDAQYLDTYGCTVLQVTWDREVAFKWQRVTVADVLAYAMEYVVGVVADGSANPSPQPSPLLGEGEARVMAIKEMIAGPEVPEGVEFIQGLYEGYVNAKIPAHFHIDIPKLGAGKAKKILKELREQGIARFPMPYVCKNQPSIRALKPWEEVFFPSSTTDLQSAPVIFVKDYYTDQDVRSMGAVEGWHKEFIEAVIETKGKRTDWHLAGEATMGEVIGEFGIVETKDELIEILTAYSRQVDEDGVAGIYTTVFSAALAGGEIARSASDATKESYGKHELLDYAHGRMPFCGLKREVLSRSFYASRGVPQIAMTWQNADKAQEDALTDRTSFETVPPIITPNVDGVDYRFGPAAQIPVMRMDQAPRFMDGMPKNATVAFELKAELKLRVCDYFGLAHAELPPEDLIAKRQNVVRRFLLHWSEAFQQVQWLMEQYMDPKEYVRITGAQEPMSESEEEIGKEYDTVFKFDVRELSPDFMDLKMKAIQETVLPADAAGTIDRAKFTRAQVRMLDADLADEILMDEGAASQKIFRQVEADFVSMYCGNQPAPVENDPTASAQVQFAQQIVQTNKEYQKKLAEDEGFRERVEMWFENRLFSVTQERNKVVGRIGVNPDAVE